MPKKNRPPTGYQLLEAAREQEARARAAREQFERLARDPRRVIAAACAGTIETAAVERPRLRALVETIAASDPAADARASLETLLKHVHDEADFLFDSATIGGRALPYLGGLIKLNDRRGNWVCTLRTWTPPSHNARRQFGSLARHLTARFPVPHFMDEAWLDTGAGTRRLRDWFVHIGSGRNIRTAKTPIKLTKMMAHWFIQAPDELRIIEAMRWGQIHALGGNDTLAEAILATRLGHTFENDEFWSSVIRFFVANPMLHRRQVGPIIDYLNHQRFVPLEVAGADGFLRIVPPPQPNLSMRGRTANALLAQMERWHHEMGRLSDMPAGLQYPRAGYGPYLLVSADRATQWRIRELSSHRELVAEGRELRHCVASYAHACAAGHCSIWSLEVSSQGRNEKLQTIEVTRQRQIVQCRGRCNRYPTKAEMEIVKAWARAEGLSLSARLGVEG
jgi:PcfJ-like protein